jgi:hypothetical protein
MARTIEDYKKIFDEVNAIEYEGKLRFPDIRFSRSIRQLVPGQPNYVLAMVRYQIDNNFNVTIQDILLNKTALEGQTDEQAYQVIRHEAGHLYWLQICGLAHTDRDLAWIAWCHKRGLVHNYCR